jgi:indole-3-glycerol phosphate synthase
LNLWALHTLASSSNSNQGILLHLHRCDFTVDGIQIVNAAANGASAITLSSEMTDDLKSQVDLCKKHEIEPLVMIKSVEDGASCIASDRTCYVLPRPYSSLISLYCTLCA